MRALAFLIAGAVAAGAPAASAESFAGKTISIYVGSAAGGGYDIYSRVIGRHLPGFIPGRPTLVVQNMPGAGGAKAAAFIASVAPKDGTAIGAISPGVVVGPLLDPKMQAAYDPTKLVYLATANNGTRVCVTIGSSPVKTFADARRIKVIMGTGAEGDSTRDYANLHKNTGGAKFEMVTGYTGTPDIMLAMERHEVEGVCGWDWSSLKSQKGDYIREGGLNVILQAGLQKNEELARMGVPEVWDFISNDLDRKATELVVAQQLFGRPFIAPPGTPEPIVAALRAAFTAALKDPALLADAEKAKIDIIPSDGDTVQEGVARIYAAPKEVVERAREAIRN
jgi:tripartite-type tricarboxylate transporter receptor subunit TctC